MDFSSVDRLGSQPTPQNRRSPSVAALIAPRVQSDGRGSFFYQWDIENQSQLFAATASPGPRVRDYRDWVKRNSSLSAREMIAKHDSIVQDAAKRIGDENFRQQIARGVQVDEKILSGDVGSIRPAAAFEMLMFETALSHYSLQEIPYEFTAVALEKPATKQMRIILRVSKPNDAYIGDAALNIESELAQGWQLRAHLHNHPFDFTNEYGDFGPISPSAADLLNYRRLNPVSALISNGIETLELRQSDIDKL